MMVQTTACDTDSAADKQSANGEDAFQKDDRVRVRPELANGFTLPMRRWVADGREATVLSVWTPYGNRVNVKVQFDSRKPPKYVSTFQEVLMPAELELVSRPTPTVKETQ